jgi:hypothetical protein
MIYISLMTIIDPSNVTFPNVVGKDSNNGDDNGGRLDFL